MWQMTDAKLLELDSSDFRDIVVQLWGTEYVDIFGYIERPGQYGRAGEFPSDLYFYLITYSHIQEVRRDSLYIQNTRKAYCNL